MVDVLINSATLVSSCKSYESQQQKQTVSFGVVGRICRIKGFGKRVKSKGLRLEAASFNGQNYGKSFVVEGSLQKVKEVEPLQDSRKAQNKLGLRLKGLQNWWEKGLQPNMKEVTSAQDLVNSLLNAGDKLVILHFFSPGCAGCRALHPKICQLAEMNPEVQFLDVNYEEHKSMCYSLNVHVLPFFRFYRGAHGRLCSFSCTNATIKKFKDALAKHSTDRCSILPTKGLEEKELLALANNKDLSFTYNATLDQPVSIPSQQEEVAIMVQSHSCQNLPLPRRIWKTVEESEGKTLNASSR